MGGGGRLKKFEELEENLRKQKIFQLIGSEKLGGILFM